MYIYTTEEALIPEKMLDCLLLTWHHPQPLDAKGLHFSESAALQVFQGRVGQVRDTLLRFRRPKESRVQLSLEIVQPDIRTNERFMVAAY